MAGRITTARVSLEDVARLAGVSTATVSRVLNGSAAVRESRREAVEKACHELGYVINRAARTLASRKSMTIGAVVPTLAIETFSCSIDAFQTVIHQQGYTLLLANSGFDMDVEFKEVNKLLEYGIDALLLVGHTHHPQLRERIEQQGIPCIQAFSTHPQSPGIGYDSAQASAQLLDHLLSLGHQRFAVISGHPPSNDRLSERLEGIRRGLQAAGLTLSPENCIDNAFTMNEARQAMFRLLDGPQPPTAVMCGNDLLAFGALRAARERYLRIPNDISVTGFNDYEYAEHLEYPLTTVRVDLAEIGRLCADYLLSALAGVPAEGPRQIATRLIIRGSTGTAPQP